jgi:WD40 repeat protein
MNALYAAVLVLLLAAGMLFAGIVSADVPTSSQVSGTELALTATAKVGGGAPPGTPVPVSDDFNTYPVISVDNAADLQIVMTLSPGDAWLADIAWSQDGSMLAVSGLDGLWLYQTGELQFDSPLSLPGHTLAVMDVNFSPDGSLLASASRDATIRIWDTATGDLITILNHDGEVNYVEFIANGAILASSGFDGIRLWDVATFEQIGITGSGAFSFSPNSGSLAGMNAGSLTVWDVSSLTETAALTTTGSVWDISFSADGQWLAAGTSNSTVDLWDAVSLEFIGSLEGHTETVYNVEFSPDSTLLASGSWDDTVKVWDLKQGTLLVTLTGPESAVSGVEFFPSGRVLASGSNDGEVRIWAVPG